MGNVCECLRNKNISKSEIKVSLDIGDSNILFEDEEEEAIKEMEKEAIRDPDNVLLKTKTAHFQGSTHISNKNSPSEKRVGLGLHDNGRISNVKKNSPLTNLDFDASSYKYSINEIKNTKVLEFYVCFIGAKEVGKTSLIQRYMYNHFDQYHVPTLETQEEISISVYENRKINLHIIDTSVIPNKQINEATLQKCNCIVYVFDLKDLNTLIFVKKSIVNYSKHEINSIIVGNKNEILRSGNNYDSTSHGRDFVNDIQMPYIDCSAKTNYNVNKLFSMIIEHSSNAKLKD